jgi:hypothetical protein
MQPDCHFGHESILIAISSQLHSERRSIADKRKRGIASPQ